ncbi:GNAT family N-acetyltransferase [Egibacter rhizosphaerae]|uniref:GNAT family N-acetyltransferase n=1 Tax=Egibacter rhizosphaerae TaxID=1670831 RepID=UPI003B836E86
MTRRGLSGACRRCIDGRVSRGALIVARRTALARRSQRSSHRRPPPPDLALPARPRSGGRHRGARARRLRAVLVRPRHEGRPVEPLRTEDDHQRRGLARHLVTAGLRRLVDLGAERIRISWEAENPASSAVYPGHRLCPDATDAHLRAATLSPNEPTKRSRVMSLTTPAVTFGTRPGGSCCVASLA